MSPKSLISYAEAADFLCIAPVTLRKWVSERRVPFVKLGRSVRFDPDELQAWIDEQRVPVQGGRR